MKKFSKKKYKFSWHLVAFFLTACLAVWPSGALAAPAISGVSGTVSQGNSITITGTGFGSSGPNILLFDDFEKGTNTSLISTASGSATIRNWTTRSSSTSSPAYSTEYAFSGSKSMRNSFNREGVTGAVYAGLNNLGGVNEIYYSYWQMLPIGRDVPGTNNPDGPNWKFSWLYGSSFPMSDYLIVMLGNSFPDSGNCAGPAMDDLGSPQRWSGGWFNSGMNRGVWHRQAYYYKGGQTDGIIDINFINKNVSNIQVAKVNNVNTMHLGEYWYNLNIPGYGRDDANSVVHYDDVYVAVGPNCRARVEIGNNSNYGSCTNMAIATVTSWTSSSINATFRQGSFTAGSPAYLFVIDSTGAASAGYPVTIGNSGGIAPSSDPCSFSLNTTSASLDSSAHNGSISVTASASTCSWTAASNSSWITITSGSSGTGSGNVMYSITQNTSTSQRTGTITAAGNIYTIQQTAGVAPTCSFSLVPTSANAIAEGQTGTINVTTSSSGCTWTAVSQSDWITITSGSSGTRTGSGTVQYSVAPSYATAQRTGTIVVGGKTFTILQAGATGTEHKKPRPPKNLRTISN